MKVKDLIKKLQKFDENKQVFIKHQDDVFFKDGYVNEGLFNESENYEGAYIWVDQDSSGEEGVFLDIYE